MKNRGLVILETLFLSLCLLALGLAGHVAFVAVMGVVCVLATLVWAVVGR
jgi:hypothetical protein